MYVRGKCLRLSYGEVDTDVADFCRSEEAESNVRDISRLGHASSAPCELARTGRNQY
jgi:hypothetical protein